MAQQAETHEAKSPPPSLPLIIIVAGCLIALLSFGPRTAMGLFLAPMTDAKGWSREIFALSIAIQNLMWGVGQPFAGALADRYGPMPVLGLGGLLYAAGLALMAWAPTPLWLYITAGLMVGTGMAAASFSIVLAAFGKRVPPHKQPMIFGIGTAAGSFGQFIFAPFGQEMINGYGWAEALIILGALTLIIPVLALAFAGNPRSAARAETARQKQSLTEAIQEAFGYRSYVLLTIGFFVCGFHVAFIATHLPAYISDLGLGARIGAWALALIGLFNIAGSLGSGIVGERYSMPHTLSLIYILRAAVIALFVTLPASPASVLLFSAAIGLLWLSTVPLTSALVALMFGPKYMATLMGFVFFSHQVGAFLGVWLGGKLFDQTGSYDVVWWLAVALGIAAAIIHWPIKQSPAPAPSPA